jgi:2-hydroxy-6-oxonona-2,4-dienedioate hydrolase
MRSLAGAPVTRRQALWSLIAAGSVFGTIMTDDVALGQNTRFTRLPVWQQPRVKGFKDLSGNRVYYEESGQGVPVVLTAASNYDAESTRGVAEQLATKYRVIAWDRANCGYSDFVFKGARDVDLWSDQLAELLISLNVTSAFLAGCSGGMRTSFHTALRHPDCVRGLILWDMSGSNLYHSLSHSYLGQYADLAEKQGMQAVAKTPYWARLIKLNPSNQERLLRMDPREFVRVFRRWQSAYVASDVVLQVSEADCRKLSASGIPARLIAGCDDDHPRAGTEQMAKLIPGADFITPPGFCDEALKRAGEAAAWAKAHNEENLAPSFEHSALPGLIDEFITKTEAKAKH